MPIQDAEGSPGLGVSKVSVKPGACIGRDGRVAHGLFTARHDKKNGLADRGAIPRVECLEACDAPRILERLLRHGVEHAHINACRCRPGAVAFVHGEQIGLVEHGPGVIAR